MSPKGGLGFQCRSCERAGLQPFAGKKSISFWVRSNANTTSPYESSVPKGTVRAAGSVDHETGSHAQQYIEVHEQVHLARSIPLDA
jgi:hypothetical protein